MGGSVVGVLCQNLRFKSIRQATKTALPTRSEPTRESPERDEQEAAFLARRLPVDRFLWRHEKIRSPRSFADSHY